MTIAECRKVLEHPRFGDPDCIRARDTLERYYGLPDSAIALDFVVTLRDALRATNYCTVTRIIAAQEFKENESGAIELLDFLYGRSMLGHARKILLRAAQRLNINIYTVSRAFEEYRLYLERNGGE